MTKSVWLKRLYYAVSGIVIITAILLQSVRILAPQINYLRSDLESFLSHQIPAQVKLGQLSAAWYGLRPHLLVKGVSITDDANTVLFSTNKVDLTLDIMASLLQQQWVWKKVKLGNTSMDIREVRPSDWELAGLSLKASDQNSGNLNAILDSVPELDISSISINLSRYNKTPVMAHIPAVVIENDAEGFQRFSGSATVGSAGLFTVIIERVDNHINGFLKLKDIALDSLLSYPNEQSADLYNEQINAEVWFDIETDNTLTFSGNFTAPTFRKIPFFDQSRPGLSLKTQLYGKVSNPADWSINFRNTYVNNNYIGQMLLTKEQDRLTFLLDKLSVQPWLDLTQTHFQYAEKHKQLLNDIAPQGQLKNVAATLYPSSWQNSVFTADVVNLSVLPSKGIPGIENVNGVLQTGSKQGFINITSQAVSFLPQAIYENPFELGQVDGQVAWTLEPKNNRFIINSNRLSAKLGDQDLAAFFRLESPWVSGTRKSDLNLQLGLRKVPIQQAYKLLPKTLPESLQTWMSSSLKSGELVDTGLIYRGPVSRERSDRSVQLFSTITDATVNYKEGWPELEEVSGQLVVDSQNVRVSVPELTLLNDVIQDVELAWSNNKRQQLGIDINTPLSISTGLRFLRESGLSDQYKDTLNNIDIKGNGNLQAKLKIPLVTQEEGSKAAELAQNINLEFLQNTIEFKSQNLIINSLDGNLNYDTNKGFVADNLAGVLFNQPFSASFKQDVKKEDVQYLLIQANGSAEVQALSQWLGRPELGLVEGVIPYQASLEIPNNKSSKTVLTVNSNLIGLQSDLPAPFNKDKNEPKSLKLVSDLERNAFNHQVILGDNIKASLQQKNNKQTGYVAINRSEPPLEKISENSVQIIASLDEVDVQQWQKVGGKLENLRNSFSAKRPRDDESLDLNYDLDVETLLAGSNYFDKLSITGSRAGDQWELDLKQQYVQGTMAFDSGFVNPVNITLDYLRLRDEDAQSDENIVVEPIAGDVQNLEDPLKDIDLSFVKAANVTVKQLVYKGKTLGDWNFTVTPLDNGLLVENIHANFSGLSLSGELNNKGAQLLWVKNSGSLLGGISTPNSDQEVGHWQTKFSGHLQGGGINTLFEDLNMPVFFESETTDMMIDVSWSGSPAFFSVKRLAGNVSVNMTDGLFVQSQSAQASTGVLRLFGLFNFDTWARRIRLDFSDLYKKGIVFDSLDSRMSFNDGNIYFTEPLRLVAPSSEFNLAGSINYPKESIDAVLITTLPVGGNLTFATALAAGLPTAAGVYLISKIFKPQVDKVSSLTYSVKGGWNKPEVKFIDVFDNDLEDGK